MPNLPLKLQHHDLANFQNLASELEMQGELCVHRDSAGCTKQSLTNAFKTLLYIHAIAFSERCWDCFTHIKDCNTYSPELFWSVEWDIVKPSQQPNEVQSSWAVLKPSHRGTAPQHGEKCYRFDWVIWLHLFMWAAFSHMIIKSKYHSTMKDHLEVRLRLAIYCPDYTSLADSIQCLVIRLR